MANSFSDLTSMITKIIRDTTRYHVPRIGQVSSTEDESEKGRILVKIPSFGWDTDETATWCYPKDKKSLLTPRVDDYVLVEFINGNSSMPIYSGMANQMKDMLPSAYDGSANTQILFENNLKDFSIRYDEENELLNIGEAGESYVKGDTLKPELQKIIDALAQLQTDFTAWVPVPMDGGLVLKTILTGGFLIKLLGSLTDMLSERIKGE